MKLKFLLGFIVSFPALNSVGQEIVSQNYTLSRVLEIALANNTEVAQGEFDVKRAALNLKQAKSNLLPELSATINHGLNQGRSIDPFSNSYVNQNIGYGNYSLGGELILFSGLIQKNLIKKNLIDYQASKLAQQERRENTTIAVLQAYFQILNNQELLRQALGQSEVTQKQADRLAVLVKQGAISPSQLSEIHAQLANDELAITDSKNALEMAKLNLTRLMNVPYQSNFSIAPLAAEVESPNFEHMAAAIYALALEHLALYKASVLRRESARKSLSVARGSRLPQLSLTGDLFSNYSSVARASRVIGYSDLATGSYVTLNGEKLSVINTERQVVYSRISYRDQIRNNYSSSLGLSLRIPLTGSLKYRNQVLQAKVDVDAAELAEETTKQELKYAVDLAILHHNAARERVETLSKQTGDYKEAFRAAEVRFSMGMGTIVDYTVAKNNVDRSNFNLINARYDLLMKTKILDYYQGKL